MTTLHTTVGPNQVVCQPRAWTRFLLEAKNVCAKRAAVVHAKQKNFAKSGLRLPLELENPFRVPTSILRETIR